MIVKILWYYESRAISVHLYPSVPDGLIKEIRDHRVCQWHSFDWWAFCEIFKGL
jgi:hypothetical protein